MWRVLHHLHICSQDLDFINTEFWEKLPIGQRLHGIFPWLPENGHLLQRTFPELRGVCHDTFFNDGGCHCGQWNVVLVKGVLFCFFSLKCHVFFVAPLCGPLGDWRAQAHALQNVPCKTCSLASSAGAHHAWTSK